MTCVASRSSRLTLCTPGAIDELSVHVSDGHVLPLILRAVCLSQASAACATVPPLRRCPRYLTARFPSPCSQTPGEGHVEAAANDFENALIMSGQLQQSELDGWLSPFRSSVARLSVDVVREETRIKLALMQASVMFQCLTKHRVTPSDRPALPSSGWKPDGSRWRRSIMSLRRRRQSSSIPRYPRGLYHFVDGFQRLQVLFLTCWCRLRCHK